MPDQRKGSRPGFVTRSVPLALPGGGPASVDEASRSVEFVAATDAPCEVWDSDEWDLVPEVLLMDGCRLPGNGQVPLLDSHSWYRVGDVLGSFREFRVEGGSLLGRACFSAVAAGEEAWVKVREGHLTDVSVGYSVESFVWIEAGKTAEVNGREFSGPLRVATEWRLYEVSVCPVGADPAAKARAANHKETTMATNKQGQRADAVCDYLDAATSLCTLTGGPVCEFLSKETGSCGKPADAPRDPDPQDPASTEDPGPEAGGEPQALPAALPGPDDGARAQEAVRAERRRIQALRQMGRNLSLSEDMVENFITRGTSVDAAGLAVLEHLQAREAAGFRTASVERSENDKVRSAARDSLLLRCGLSVAKPAPGAAEYRSMSMREMARDFLARSGRSLSGDIKDIVGRALTTTDLPGVLTDTANAVLLDAFERAEHTWDLWAGTGSLNDFKISSLVGVDWESELKKVREDGEYTYAYAGEHGETVQLATYGRIYPITRQAIINDNLGVFTDMAAVRGRAAANTVNNLAYRALAGNPVMSDGKRLFSAEHKNLHAGAGGVPDVEKLGAAVTGMKLQRNASGELLRINPQYFLAPVALEVASETFFNTTVIGTQERPNVTNLYGGQRFTRVYDPVLDDADPAAWYLLGPKSTGIVVYFLSGTTAPRLEEKQGWTIDGVEFKVSIDAAAAPVSWLGMAKSQTAAK